MPATDQGGTGKVRTIPTEDAVFAKELLDNRVVGDGDALTINFCIAALVDELADRLEIGLAICDEGVDNVEHLLSRLGYSDEHAVVDLK